MNNPNLYHALFRLLSLSDDNDIRGIVASAGGLLCGKGKISFDELNEIIVALKKD
ncbi:MAG: hypothetical protein RR681_07795 [Lachnospiraceae bacterium]